MEENRKSSDSCFQKCYYGLGHVHNDLCASVWFSYTLFYFQVVLQMDSTTAGFLVLLGQLIDALATPAAGWAVDRIGTRKVWHLAGTVAVSMGFVLIFSLSDGTNHWTLGMAISIFQIGWATVQISHLSIIPTISQDQKHSSDLTTIRYTASVCCGITVYILAWVLLKTDNGQNVLQEIGPKDFNKFQKLSLIVTIIGIICSIVFYCGTEINQPCNYNIISENASKKRENSWNFLKSMIIYQVSLMQVPKSTIGDFVSNVPVKVLLRYYSRMRVSTGTYMTSRLYTILNLIYMPLYLNERHLILDNDLDGIRETIAIVPLVSFLSSFLTSILLKWKSKHYGNNVTYVFIYLIGSILELSTCLWIGIELAPDSHFQIYGVAIFIGMGSSVTMITSLCITAEFVQIEGFKSGSVYSTVTFTDKLLCGGIVLITQYLECKPKKLCPNFYKYVLAYVCGCSVFIGLITLISLNFNVSKPDRDTRDDST